VEHVFRRFGPTPDALEHHGLYAEALLASDAKLAEWAVAQVSIGCVQTVFSSSYPLSWLRKLGNASPPAFWVQGQLPEAPPVSLAGSRSPTPDALFFVEACSSRVAEAGMALVSGGALGCDASAMSAYLKAGGLQGLEILPRGLGPSDGKPNVCSISIEAPGTPFNRLAAQKRNALLYAFSEATIAVQPRFREGGTWHGALGALRQRLCQVVLMEEPVNSACVALRSLGASAMTSAEAQSLSCFLERLCAPSSQPALFPHAV
jgi:predicted Rossmann fold nucleotide-binding protein DprA/Smf involved in DNA uptake